MRTESEEITSSSSGRSSPTSMAESAAAAGKWTAKLAGYAVATVAVTFMLLRPRRAATGKRGSLFLGSGVIVVLIKTLLSTSDGSDASPAPAPAAPVLAAATPAPAPARPAPQPAAAPRKRPANAAAAPAKPGGPAEAVAKKPQPAAPVVKSPAAKPAVPATAAVAEATKPTPAAPAKKPAAAPAKPASPLGPRYADKNSGYSVQFPTGWTSKPFKDGCWVVDASDGQGAITVGFSKFPATMTVDEVVPEKVTRGLQKRAGTVVHGTGYATIAGRRCLWHKYTGPVSRPEGSARMTAVHYLLPLRDGRALELRVAATPEAFGTVAPRMKQSLDSFKLLTPVADAASARAR